MKFSLICFALIAIPVETLNAQVDVIYGRDNRYEVRDYDEQVFIDKAKSVAIKVPSRRLTVDRKNKNLFNIPLITLADYNPGLCPNERFVNQFPIGTCSGFLVAPDTIVTAGHCMFSENDCESYKWVFDYTEGTEKIKANNTYSCKKIIAQRYNYTKEELSDYAVIKLDRPVKGRKPLAVRKFGVPFYGTELVLIGHPLGLPMKIADGAEVKMPNAEEQTHLINSLRLRDNYFTANLDSYAGNSGSPVFNKHSGKVEGILIQGADDFTDGPNGCLTSARRGNSANETMEKVMRITKVPGV